MDDAHKVWWIVEGHSHAGRLSLYQLFFAFIFYFLATNKGWKDQIRDNSHKCCFVVVVVVFTVAESWKGWWQVATSWTEKLKADQLRSILIPNLKFSASACLRMKRIRDWLRCVPLGYPCKVLPEKWLKMWIQSGKFFRRRSETWAGFCVNPLAFSPHLNLFTHFSWSLLKERWLLVLSLLIAFFAVGGCVEDDMSTEIHWCRHISVGPPLLPLIPVGGKKKTQTAQPAGEAGWRSLCGVLGTINHKHCDN